MDQTFSADTDDLLSGQPHRIVERDGVRYTLLGTAHVSKASLDAVREAIASGRYDTIAVELDAQRLQSLTDPDSLSRLDLIKVLREGKASLFAASAWPRTSAAWPSSSASNPARS